ncbi:MAG: hypothetical protein IJ825_02515 [Oscillospiraceae bacterium]|nr:hypothetical protein [Oscillospiraceae bacterium]
MCKLFDDWSEDIRKYCEANGFSFEKARKLSQCWGGNFLALQYYDPENGKQGLLDETPMPLVLLIRKTENGLEFEQTEHTAAFLAA